MALLLRRGDCRYWGGVLQESIYQKTEPKQVVQGPDQFRFLCQGRRGGGEGGPLGWNVRFTAIRQNDDKEQLTVFIQVPKDLERLSFEGMMSACNRDPVWIVPDVGSLRWFPSTESTMTD